VIRVAIVSPLLAVRAGLRAMLDAAGSGELQVVAEAARLSELAVFPMPLDILLITAEALSFPDLIRMSSPSGADSAPEGRLAVLVLAEDGRLARELERLPLRAWGILSLDTTVDELAAGLRAVAQGLWVADPLLVRTGLPRLFSAQEGEESPGGALTERENQVLQLLARGLANKQIAVALGISEHTVKFHVSSIYTRLGVTNRAEAVRRGIQQGWVVL
jgi:DNA-binding NarL/FixJ family response regulator